jgi:hypothetical protein
MEGRVCVSSSSLSENILYKFRLNLVHIKSCLNDFNFQEYYILGYNAM